MTLRALIDTVVIVMMENRSFDHLLGHLSYGAYANSTDVDGLRDPLQREAYENLYQGETYYPFEMRDGALASDLPHERELVATQLARSAVTGRFRMSGFAEAYFRGSPVNRTLTPDAMGFLTPTDLPVTTFFANEFAVCDRWFAPLPTSTQPNRMMALYGSSAIDHTRGVLPPVAGTLFLDWLSARGVRWRVYHAGLSYFSLLGRFDLVLGDRFRAADRLAADVATESADSFPQVIVVEPSYGDAPHLGSDLPNDNHPPLAVGFGEQFLREIYRALTCNPSRWAKTVMLLTYDEHGGFFDHVPPPPIHYHAPHGEYPAFDSAGVRVPAVVVSPLVAPRTVHRGTLDHTSILQFLAWRFGRNGEPYSSDVETRRTAGVGSVADVLTLDAPRTTVPREPQGEIVATAVLGHARGGPATDMQAAFARAATEMVDRHPGLSAEKYPDLVHWRLTADAATAGPPG